MKPKTTTRVEYHRQARLDDPNEPDWQSSSAWGFNSTKAPAVSSAKDLLKKGRYGYTAKAVRVVKYTITTTTEVVWEQAK